MFSVFEVSRFPDEVHISKLSLWLSSQKGAESSTEKVSERSRVIQKEFNQALHQAIQQLQANGSIISNDLLAKLRIYSDNDKKPEECDNDCSLSYFKPKKILTYYDYENILKSLAEACGLKGVKNMFGFYTEPNLIVLKSILTKWETDYLHLVHSSESLTSLMQLIYPFTKRSIDDNQKRFDELSRQISEHERFAQIYDNKYKDMCAEWGLDATFLAAVAAGIEEKEWKTDDGDETGNKDGCVVDDSLAGHVDIRKEVLKQLESFTSSNHKQLIFEKILAQINTEEFIDCFLHYQSYATSLSDQMPGENSSSQVQPLFNLHLAARKSLADRGITSFPSSSSSVDSDCVQQGVSLTASGYLDIDTTTRNSSGSDEWTHVSSTDVTDDNNPEVQLPISETDLTLTSLPEQQVVCDVSQQMQYPHFRDSLIQEVVLLKSFFLSQRFEKKQPQTIIASAPTALRTNSHKEDNSLHFTPPSADFVNRAIAVIQSVQDSFESNEFLNMLSLEQNPNYILRVHQAITLNYEKSKMFQRMARREMQEKTKLKHSLAQLKQNLNELTENIFSLKSSLEATINALFCASSLGSSKSVPMTIIGNFDDFKLVK